MGIGKLVATALACSVALSIPGAAAAAPKLRGACTAYKVKFCGSKVKGYPPCIVSHAAETSADCQAQIKQAVGR